MTEAGLVTPTQSKKRYDRMPHEPPSPHTLFVSNRPGQHVAVIDAGRMLLNEYLGLCLKKYIQLLIEAFRLHNNKIKSSVFPLLTPQADNGTAIKTRVTRYLGNSNSLRGQLRTFKGVWETNTALHPNLPCYTPRPAQWIDEVMATNDQVVLWATQMITEFDIRLMQRQVQSQRLEVENTNIQRNRDTGTDAPRALLSYNEVVSMKPSSRGRHDMSNKEWKKFQEEASEWFSATWMGAFPQTNQTRLMETVLDNTLLTRSIMKLKERGPLRNFFSAAEILTKATEQRGPQLYP